MSNSLLTWYLDHFGRLLGQETYNNYLLPSTSRKVSTCPFLVANVGWMCFKPVDMSPKIKVMSLCRIHGTGIFTYRSLICLANVVKYTIVLWIRDWVLLAAPQKKRDIQSYFKFEVLGSLKSNRPRIRPSVWDVPSFTPKTRYLRKTKVMPLECSGLV